MYVHVQQRYNMCTLSHAFTCDLSLRLEECEIHVQYVCVEGVCEMSHYLLILLGMLLVL